MSSEAFVFEMGNSEREERVEVAFIPPHIEMSRYSSKTRNVWEKPENSGKFGDSRKIPNTPAFQG
jgi:hypothetical protein